MFGIGAGELVLIAIVVLLAVGPNQMPKMLRVVGKGVREVRKATRELQSTVGLNDILSDDELRDPLGLNKPAGKPGAKAAPKPTATPAKPTVTRPGAALTDEDIAREQPSDGVDLDLAYSRSHDAIIARKQAAAAEQQAEPAFVPEPGPHP